MTLKLQVVPEKAIVVQREKTIVAASWFGPWVARPYIYPFLGPGNRELTRLGHPGDPVGHSHHRSIWIGHHDAAGVNFWEESPRAGRIVQEEIGERREEGDEVGALCHCVWQDAAGKEVLREKRRLRFFDLPGEELALELGIELTAPREPVVLGRTNFGLLGIRVARTLRVEEGLGGLVYNSEEAENEAGCMGQHALWCDTSGPLPAAGPVADGSEKLREETPDVLPAMIAGIACFDHPANAGEEGTLWHVRDDGWMGPGLTRAAPRTIEPGKPLEVTYRIEAHAGRPWQAAIGERYRQWRRASTRRQGE
jgi:hypothetical protein